MRWALRLIAARTPSPWDDELVASVGGPLMVAWSLALVQFGSQYLLLVKPAYRLIDGLTTAGIVFTVFWSLWRATAAAGRAMLSRPWARDSASAFTLISVGTNLARGAVVVIGALAILSVLGYPVGTLLAGLGIGGLALAFGAQKTIENLFGSVSIAVDQPFRVGDFASVDGVIGVVGKDYDMPIAVLSTLVLGIGVDFAIGTTGNEAARRFVGGEIGTKVDGRFVNDRSACWVDDQCGERLSGRVEAEEHAGRVPIPESRGQKECLQAGFQHGGSLKTNHPPTLRSRREIGAGRVRKVANRRLLRREVLHELARKESRIVLGERLRALVVHGHHGLVAPDDFVGLGL